MEVKVLRVTEKEYDKMRDTPGVTVLLALAGRVTTVIINLTR